MTFETLTELATISSASIVIPIIIALAKLRSHDRTQRILLFLVVAAGTTELLAHILSLSEVNNLPVYNTYTIVHFNLVFLIYLFTIKKEYRRYLIAFQVAFNLFALINAIFFQPYNTFNSNLIVSVSVSYLLLALGYFYKLLREVKFQTLEKNPLFWLNAGLIIYYSGTLILFLLINQVSTTDPEVLDLHLASWGLNSFFNLILNSSYAVALWVRPMK